MRKMDFFAFVLSLFAFCFHSQAFACTEQDRNIAEKYEQKMTELFQNEIINQTDLFFAKLEKIALFWCGSKQSKSTYCQESRAILDQFPPLFRKLDGTEIFPSMEIAKYLDWRLKIEKDCV